MRITYGFRETLSIAAGRFSISSIILFRRETPIRVHSLVPSQINWAKLQYTHRTESTSVETVVAFKTLLIRLSRTAQWHQPH